jgi:carbonic anhydrase
MIIFRSAERKETGRAMRIKGKQGNHHVQLLFASRLSRRSILLGGGALATIPLVGRVAGAQPVSAADTPDAALKLVTEGNERYVANQPRERDFSAGRASRALGQAPFAAILSCADSRIAPELTFDRGPGDLFVVRVAGNFVTTEGLASLEFGAVVLGTKLIMVLGHSSCGARSMPP